MRAIFGFAVALLTAMVPLVAARDMAAPPQVLPQCAVRSSCVSPRRVSALKRQALTFGTLDKGRLPGREPPAVCLRGGPHAGVSLHQCTSPEADHAVRYSQLYHPRNARYVSSSSGSCNNLQQLTDSTVNSGQEHHEYQLRRAGARPSRHLRHHLHHPGRDIVQHSGHPAGL
jgi:hypothetical protein